VETLRDYHQAVRRVCRPRGEWTEIGWCLGYARTLIVRKLHSRVRTHTRHKQRFSSDSEASSVLSNLAEYLRQPQLTGLSSCTFEVDAIFARHRRWRQVARALPASCATVGLLVDQHVNDELADTFISPLPPTVRQLALWPTRTAEAVRFFAPFCRARFDLLDVSRHQIAAAELSSDGPRLLVGSVAGRVPAAVRSRLLFGNNAALIAPGHGAVHIPSLPLVEHQRRHGPIGVHAQLARTLPEHYALFTNDNWPRVSFHGSDVARHASGDWTQLAPGGQPTPLSEGDQLHFGDTAWRFVSRDVARAFDDYCR
jgi:hypothetical protein